jgi:cellulose synthase/poly-beta-1,6-N-acetylglucosamine synthase-like glycosyltransferase
VLIILVVLFSFVIGIHMGYPLLLKYISRKKLTKSSEDMTTEIDLYEAHSDSPLVSVIIPVYNEELVIERRINNIFASSYPEKEMEVIIVDSGSKDRTSSIVQEKFRNRVILLQEGERKGKAHAINLAINICRGEILIITDGPTLYSTDTISQLVRSLGDSRVGAVTALYEIPNASENQITSSEHAYWSYKDKIRILESRAHSTSWLSGEACAFRKKIVSKLDVDTLADDSNIALQTLTRGYRALVNENCFFSEKSPSGFYDYFRIKSRRTLGGLIETLRFKSLLFNPRYGYFGLIIFPYRFFTQFISPVLTFATITLAIPAIIEIATYFGIYAVLILIAALLYFGLRFRYKIISYIYLQLITTIALFLLLTRRIRVDWAQSKTTRVSN